MAMLCSLPSGKTAPNWLDRLRSNKGFPIADHDLGLDHFLTNQHHHPSPLPHSNPTPTPTPSPNSHSPSQNGIITGILSDLFNINNGASSSSSKKFPRKQSNPKICSIPSLNTSHNNLSSAHKEDNILSSNSDNSSKAQPQNPRSKVEEDENPDKELIGYSKSEVTVIDTSCNLWKSDKLIFRRKNVWKVKDKKPKLRSYGRKKKRKPTNNNDLIPDIIIASPTKKTKLCPSDQRWNQSLNPFNKGCNPQHCSGPEISANAKENVYTLSQGNGSYDPEKSDHPSKRRHFIEGAQEN